MSCITFTLETVLKIRLLVSRTFSFLKIIFGILGMSFHVLCPPLFLVRSQQLVFEKFFSCEFVFIGIERMGWTGKCHHGLCPTRDVRDFFFVLELLPLPPAASSGPLLSGSSLEENVLFFLGTLLFPVSSGTPPDSSMGKNFFLRRCW